jgi:hypothetical protein
VKNVRWKAQSMILLAALAATTGTAVLAQSGGNEQPSTWREANDEVGKFKRGHADILKWEAENLKPTASDKTLPAGFALPTMESAIRAAWKPHLELQRVMSRLGRENVDRVATGQWMDVEARHQRRIEGLDELFEVAVDARKAWLSAVATKQTLSLQQESLEAAEAATELGRRMVKVGNWSRYQQSRVELGLSSEKLAYQQARVAAAQAEQALIKLLRLNGVHQRLELPDSLPDLPKEGLPGDRLAAELQEITAQLPMVNQTKTRINFDLARDAYRAALDVAQSYRNDVMAQRNLIVDESVLQYNGMLKSVWELLTEVQGRAQAQRETISATRDYWVAEADLMWVLQGGEPQSFVTPGAASGAEANTAGH